MKKYIGLVMLLCAHLAPAPALPAPPGGPLKPFACGPESCTVSAKLYFLTEAGLIGIGISVTAGTCSEAYQGILDAFSGFLEAI